MKLQKDWNELLFQMSGGNASDYERLKGMDEIEFFTVFELFEKKIKEQTKSQ